jgi:tetratricopeptide (TPR) repeat protein
MEAAKSGDRDRALLMVEQAKKLAPTARDFFLIGRLYNELEIYNKALSAYLEADNLGYEPKEPLYYAIATSYYYLGNYVKAIEYSSKAVDLNLNDENAKDVLLSATEKEGAGLIIDNIIEKHHDTCLAFILYAQEALKQKVFSKARRFLSKAKQLEPSPVEMYQIGRLYASLDYFEKALNVYFDCEKMGYDNKDLLYASIAGCYLYLGDPEAAIKYSSKALDLNFNNDYAKDILLYFVEIEEMGPTFDALLEKYSNTCFALIIHAQEAFRENNFSRTRDLIVKAEQLDPSPSEMYNISYLYYNLKYYKEALKASLKSEILGYSDKRRLYVSIADCYYCVEDYDKAIQYAIKALAIDPDYEYTKDLLYACREATWGTEFGDKY